MSQDRQIAREFRGTRVEIATARSFDDVLARLREQTGKSSVPHINEVAAGTRSAEEFDAEVTRRFVGSSGFMVFAQIDHGAWIAKYGIQRRVLRIILGNPLYAIAMMREDISAGLFAPVELLLVDENPGTTVLYVRPSTLMVVADNPPLKAAAQDLDRKLERLLSEITGVAIAAHD